MTTIPQFKVNFQNELYRIFRSVAFGLQTKIVQGTPIDTGRAKSSWNLSENDPNFETTPPLVDVTNPISGQIIDVGQGGALTPAQALTAAQSSQQAIGPEPRVIFIANGLDYIEGLEHGNSKQAPNGMVMVNTTVDELQLLVDEAIADKTPF